MTTVSTYRFALDKSPKKFECPLCRKKTFVRYKDNETGDYLPEQVGRCDRENNCQYHLTPKQYFEQTGSRPIESKQQTVVEPILEKPIDFIPLDFVEKSMKGFDQSNFASFLIKLFGDTVAKKLLSKYMVGRSRQDQGKANIFWRIDVNEKVRTGKIMHYNPITGKRIKDIAPGWVHSHVKKDFNYLLCFFGEHLLFEYPKKPVAICESEKTAIICSFFMPQFNWIATGGKTGIRWNEYSVYKVLNNREVVMFPDFGKADKSNKTPFNKWEEVAKHISERIRCDIAMSTILENNMNEEARASDLDLADLLIKQDPSTGIALNDEGYPAIWDYSNEFLK